MTHWYDELIKNIDDAVPGLEYVMIAAEIERVFNEYDHIVPGRVLRVWSGINRDDMKVFWVEQETLGM